jgi:hypothetical protein
VRRFTPISSKVTSLVPETINNETFAAILLSFNKGGIQLHNSCFLALFVPSLCGTHNVVPLLESTVLHHVNLYFVY